MAQCYSTKTKWWNGGKSPFNVEYGKLMMWYFLMTDAFTFGAFLISYGTIRFSQNYWADPNACIQCLSRTGHANLPLGVRSLNDLYPDHEFCNHGIGGALRPSW